MMVKDYSPSVEINHNPNWPYIPDHPHRILIIDDSGSRKANVLLNSIKQSKINSNHSINYLINGREKIRIEKLKSPKTFTDFSQTIDGLYKNLKDYSPAKKSVNSV